MSEQARNPFIEPEDYYKQLNENIQKLKNDPKVVEFDKFCYELFEAYDLGKKFLEFAKEKFFIYSQIQRGNESYKTDTVWQEGFRDAYRMIIHSVISHKQRIESGKNS